ncbi:MAG: helix-turn-helix domain-containing protein [Clostridiales bacterium]|nr:helix-turn-helix domain-containing protein [Clostridiales bacterium]
MESYFYSSPSHGDFHCHEFFEIGIVLEGFGTHYVNQQSFPMEPGTAYFIPIGTSHALELSENCLIQNLYILPKIILENLGITNDAHSIFMDFFLNCIVKNLENPIHLQLHSDKLAAIRQQVNLFGDVPELFPPLAHSYRKNIFSNLLLILCDAWIRPSVSGKDISHSRDVRILRLIAENIRLPLSEIISLLSEKLALNPQYLNRVVKNSFHTPLSQLILETKLEKSCQLLAENYSITETALALAFYDHSHYTRYFTRYFGISPSEYRSKHLLPPVS